MIISKKILSVFIILVLFLHTNYLAVYYSLYEINTEELTASCCEKIIINCNAHCYLDKKMTDEDTKNTSGTSAEIKLKITEYVVSDDTTDPTSDKTANIYLLSAKKIISDHISKIDHPPQL